MKKTKHEKKPAKLTGNEKQGLVVALFGSQAEVLDNNDDIVRCHLRKNADPVVVGDQVLFLQTDNSAVIIQHLPRTSLLSRPENAFKSKLIAANINAIVIVSAPPPVFSQMMLDRYLVAATALKISPVILINKADLLSAEEKNALELQLSIYKKLGYPIIFSSTKTQTGLTEFKNFLNNKMVVLVGASGVGKSSIIATLTGQSEIKIGETSTSGLGKHTTTLSRLYHLPDGGVLIDSPGVREFGLWNVDKNTILSGFIEIDTLSQHCQFRNCQHQNDIGCAIQQALNNDEISSARYESYQTLIAEAIDKKERFR